MYHRRVAEFRIERLGTAEKKPTLVPRAIESQIAVRLMVALITKVCSPICSVATATVYLAR